MEDIAFNWPKKILGPVVAGAFVIAGAWGLITGDSRKASELFTKELTFITKPMVNRIEKRAERVKETVLRSLQQSRQEASPR